MMDCPPIVTRENWGSMIVNTKNMTRLVLPIPQVVLTHTASRNCVEIEECKKLVRIFQRVHILDNKYSDISYHFLVGDEGTIFEGRGWDLQGAVYSGHNTISYGIAFIGMFDFGSQNEPSSIAMNSSVWLTNCALAKKNLDKDRLKMVPYSSLHLKVLQNFRDHPNAPVEPGISTMSPIITSSGPLISATTHLGNSTTSSTILQGSLVIPLTLAVGGSLVLFCLLLAIFFWKRRGNKKKIGLQILNRLPCHVLHHYTIPRGRLVIQNEEKDCLGSGNFGVVMKGCLKFPSINTRAAMDGAVAVKILRNKVTESKVHNDHLNSFFYEMEILMKTGRHANIVNLIGVILEGEPMIVMEYCSLGSLEKFLQDPRNVSRLTELSVVGSINSSDDHYVAEFEYLYHPGTYTLSSINDLISFSSQISRGMEFVSSRNIIHRDLAARNILLDGTGQAKIADFGMAREKTVYTLEMENVALPIRWMALESIQSQQGTYSTMTDVWSFGVTLWEIFSLCRVLPYKIEFPTGLNRNLLVAFLQSGERLARPLYCPETLFDLIKHCWATDPRDRLTFRQLTVELSNMLPLAMQQEYLVLDEQNESFNKELDSHYQEFSCL